LTRTGPQSRPPPGGSPLHNASRSCPSGWHGPGPPCASQRRFDRGAPARPVPVLLSWVPAGPVCRTRRDPPGRAIVTHPITVQGRVGTPGTPITALPDGRPPRERPRGAMRCPLRPARRDRSRVRGRACRGDAARFGRALGEDWQRCRRVSTGPSSFFPSRYQAAELAAWGHSPIHSAVRLQTGFR